MSDKKSLNLIDSRIITFLSGYDLYVLRTKSGKALNVSYTEDGLKYTMSRDGKFLYFKNAKLRVDRNTMKTYFVGNLAKSPWTYTEKFVPKNHSSTSNQLAEYRFVDKALRLCYNMQRFD